MRSTDERRLDGNALAGDLEALFAFELTAAVRTCAGCGHVAPLGAHPLYADAPGAVLRCPGCGDVALRVVQGPGRVWIEMQGTAALDIEL